MHQNCQICEYSTPYLQGVQRKRARGEKINKAKSAANRAAATEKAVAAAADGVELGGGLGGTQRLVTPRGGGGAGADDDPSTRGGDGEGDDASYMSRGSRQSADDGIRIMGRNRLVVGWGVYCHDFRRLPITSCCSVRVSCPCVDTRLTRRSKLPPSPAVSRCLPMSTTRLSFLPNPHPQHRLPGVRVGAPDQLARVVRRPREDGRGRR